MKCSDLRRKVFILDRNLLAKDDYLNLLARPKRTNEMWRTVSCPCQRKQSKLNIAPASLRVEELAKPKQIFTDNPSNMSIFRVETMTSEIAKRDFISPRDLKRAESEARVCQKNKECREKKLEKDRMLRGVCQKTLDHLLHSMRPVMLESDSSTENSEYYRDIHDKLLKLLKQNPDQKLHDIPKNFLSRFASKTAENVETIVDHASRVTQNEASYDCLEKCKRGMFEIERCVKPRVSEEAEYFFDAGDATLRDEDGLGFDDSDYNFVSIRDSCDDVLTKSQLDMDGVDCQEIFAHIEGYKTRATERKTEQEAKKKAKAEKLKKRAAKKAAAKKGAALPECVPGAGGPKKWEVTFGERS